MAKTVVGVFTNYSQAEEVARQLENEGYSRQDISVVANDHKGEYSNMATGDGSQAASGAGTGAAIGGAAGLALGLVALAIPGIGPVIALGPLATALTGAGIGAAAGGLIGAMTSMGVPEEDAEHYAGRVKEGDALVIVKTSDEGADAAAAMLENYGAENVDERKGVVPGSSTRVFSHSAEADVETSRSEAYRKHYQQTYESTGQPFEMYAPGYQYGSDMAKDSRYQGREWGDVETSARSDWESRGSGSWESFKGSVRHGWDKVLGKA